MADRLAPRRIEYIIVWRSQATYSLTNHSEVMLSVLTNHRSRNGVTSSRRQWRPAFKSNVFILSVTSAWLLSPGPLVKTELVTAQCVVSCIVVVCSTKWMSVVPTGRRNCAICRCWRPGLYRTGYACTHQDARLKCKISFPPPREYRGDLASSGHDRACSFSHQLLKCFIHCDGDHTFCFNLCYLKFVSDDQVRGTAFSALTLLVGWQEGIRPVKTAWWGTGLVICLERGANDLHVVQLMPLPPRHFLLQ